MNELMLRLITWANTEREEGQTLVEYALILALVSIVAIAMLTLLGTKISAIFDYIQGVLTT